MIKVSTATGAAYWASYLVNGDASGLNDRERALCDAWQKRLGNWYVVDVARDESGEGIEQRFSWLYGFHTGDDQSRGGDIIEYVIHKATKRNAK